MTPEEIGNHPDLEAAVKAAEEAYATMYAKHLTITESLLAASLLLGDIIRSNRDVLGSEFEKIEFNLKILIVGSTQALIAAHTKTVQ